MIAADTNVVLRLLLDDDEQQVNAIRRVMREQRLFVSLTVLLEVGWVLASRYRMPRARLSDVLETLLMLDGVHVARIDLLRWAIERFRTGADWADVVHLVAASKLDGFLTFDRRLGRHAGSEPPLPIETLA